MYCLQQGLRPGHKKHMKMHNDDVKFCHFYNNNKNCPYEDIGCMFLHEMADPCIFNPCLNKLCQYKHVEEIVTVEDDTHDGPMNDDQSESKKTLSMETRAICA